MTSEPPKDESSTLLRIPMSLFLRLKAVAAADQRAHKAEILVLIEEGIERREKRR